MRTKASFIPLILLAVVTMTADATRFASMSCAEISALIADVRTGSESQTVPAKGAAGGMSDNAIRLTAEDMVTKVYGLLDSGLRKEDCLEQARVAFNLFPKEDLGVYWLEGSDGYLVNYYGMMPEVSAMARFEDDAVSDYCFFFLFPYDDASRHQAVRNQAEFCGSLLQELFDLGMPMGANVATEDLFEATGDYQGSFVDVRLLDDATAADGSRYILMLSVEPAL